MMQRVCEVGLQKRADNTGTIFLVGANFWERQAKVVPLCLFLGYFWSILNLIFGSNFLWRK